MPEFTPETQIQIAQLKAIKYKGKFDAIKIEAALKKHLQALNLPDRPVEVHLSFKSAIESAARDAAWGAARGAARDAAWGAARDAAWDAAWGAARDAAWDAAWGAARDAAWGAARDAAWGAAWGAARDAARDAAWDAAWDAAIANSLHDHPDYEKLRTPFLAIHEALCAGMFAYWITPDKVFAVITPVLKFDNEERLHSLDSPAVAWADEEYYFIEGVRVDEQIVMFPETQTLAQIEKEGNEEVKRIRINQFGWRRYLVESNAQILDVKIVGDRWIESLMKTQSGMTALCTYDPSTGRPYVLEVDPDCKNCTEAQRYLLAPDSIFEGMGFDLKLDDYPVLRT
jgi:hypothetical protein